MGMETVRIRQRRNAFNSRNSVKRVIYYWPNYWHHYVRLSDAGAQLLTRFYVMPFVNVLVEREF